MIYRWYKTYIKSLRKDIVYLLIADLIFLVVLEFGLKLIPAPIAWFVTGMPNVEDKIMKVRHRVIHGGYVPSHEEANSVYLCTRQALAALNVPMFE